MKRLLLYKYLALTGIIIALALIIFDYSRETAVNFYTSLKGKTIAIDPGHGGIDGGASLNNKLHEKNINLHISLKLQKLLEESGAQVIMTRDSDISLEEKSDLASSRYRRDLDARRDIINRGNVDAFVSIHSNCFLRNPQARGAIVFYHPGSVEGKKLATAIAKNIDDIVYGKLLGNSGISTKILGEDLFILRNTYVTGVLVEVGYISNWEEKTLLQKDDFQASMTEAIRSGLQEYFWNMDDNHSTFQHKKPVAKLIKLFLFR
ncbi:MAG: N-acetylmuramoyl-L-alanine amidase family protein [Caulobacteraceae bacterium]